MKSLTDEGLFNIEIGKSYQVRVVIEDFSGNASYIEMYIEGTNKRIPNKKLEGKLIEPRFDYILTFNDKEVFFPKKTFFENAIIQIEEAKNTIRIGPNLFPFNNPYEI